VKHRILHIIPTLDRAGAEKQMTLLVCGLPRERFDVSVCALSRGGPYVDELRRAGVEVTVIGKRWRLDPAAYVRLKRHVAALRPDIVHTWLFAANAYGRAAALACGVPCLVAGERCVDPWKSPAQLWLDRRLAQHSARIVANSRAVRDFYVGHGLPPDRFEVIPNGVPEPPQSHYTRRRLLEQLGLASGSRLVGLVGRLWRQKRVKDAIWAADLLKVVRDDTHLLVIGDGPLRPRLEGYRDQVEIGDRVHFLGHRDDVADLMPHFDVLLSTSGYEGQSNAILEAMACGVPVVATDIPGTRDLVTDGQAGLLAPVGDRALLARWVDRLLSDPELARRLGESGRQRARCHFSVAEMVRRYAALYEELLDRSPGHTR
jgi:glycosyltransferase involved in cell wall biosynthesis